MTTNPTIYSVEWVGKDGKIYYSEVGPDGAGPVMSPESSHNFMPMTEGILGLCIVIGDSGSTTVFKRIAEIGPNTSATAEMSVDELAEEFLSEPGLYELIADMHEQAEKFAEDNGTTLGATVQ